MKALAVIAVATIAATAFLRPVQAATSSCGDLARVSLPYTRITEAQAVAAGAFRPSSIRSLGTTTFSATLDRLTKLQGARVGELYAHLPAFCRVTATVRPVAGSDIEVEVCLPARGWNGRLEGVGNGAFQSNIFYNDLAQAVIDGYAVVATNTGHEGNSGAPMIGHPQRLIDWGYRAVHEMTVTAKSLIAAYYGGRPKYSYWNSCSTGGREGWMEAEYYPEDYSGLVIGDAPNPMTLNQASTLYSNLAMNQSAAALMSPANWAAYRRSVLESCGGAQAVKDGYLNDPSSCDFDPAEMLCKHGDGPDCLTAPQISALKKLLAGMKDPRTAKQLYPGWPPGANPSPHISTGHRPEQVAIDTFRILFDDPSWDYHTMDFDKDITLAQLRGSGVMDASDPGRLAQLFGRGGKILMYHGWHDPAITPLEGIKLYQEAVAANGGVSRTYDSIRLFMVPGMNHCGGGAGPNVFDKMRVITDWVEHGKAPDRIVAAHMAADGHIDRTRPLCPYPQIARYKGTGSINEARNFFCANP